MSSSSATSSSADDGAKNLKNDSQASSFKDSKKGPAEADLDADYKPRYQSSVLARVAIEDTTTSESFLVTSHHGNVVPYIEPKETTFHYEGNQMGDMNSARTKFTKKQQYHGLLSTVSESNIRLGGCHRYCIKFHDFQPHEKEVGSGAHGLSL